MKSWARLRMVLGRIGQALPALFGVIVVTFILTRALPGDPAVYFAGPAADEASIQQIREALGLDRPLYEQFVYYLGDLASGNLGVSISTGQPVLEELARRLPASLELTLGALLLSLAIAIPMGVLAATNPGRPIDHICRVIATAGVSLPTFFTGIT
jgi:peptide/nickel transport system permease protein